jgi:hypothetical protein
MSASQSEQVRALLLTMPLPPPPPPPLLLFAQSLAQDARRRYCSATRNGRTARSLKGARLQPSGAYHFFRSTVLVLIGIL